MSNEQDQIQPSLPSISNAKPPPLPIGAGNLKAASSRAANRKVHLLLWGAVLLFIIYGVLSFSNSRSRPMPVDDNFYRNVMFVASIAMTFIAALVVGGIAAACAKGNKAGAFTMGMFAIVAFLTLGQVRRWGFHPDTVINRHATSGRVAFRSDDPPCSFQLPPGFKPYSGQLPGTKPLGAFIKIHRGEDPIYLIVGAAQGMYSTNTAANEQWLREILPEAQVFRKQWLGQDIAGARSVQDPKQGHTVFYTICVPLSPQSIWMSIQGPEHRSKELDLIIEETLKTLDGTNGTKPAL